MDEEKKTSEGDHTDDQVRGEATEDSSEEKKVEE